MLTKSIRKYLQNQYVAGFSATLLVMVSGSSFVWVSPILHLLNKEKYQDVIIPMTSTEISWMVSLIEIGSLFSPLLSGILSDCFGRKLSIVFVGPFMIAGWSIILMTRDVLSLYIVRVLHGFAMGALFTTVPMYLGEIAEAKVRGALTSSLQTLWYTGFLLQYIIGSYLSYDNSAIFNLILTTTVFLFFGIVQPESPYYLTVRKRDEKACKSLMLLRGKSSMNDVEAEIQNIRDCVEKDMKNKVKWSDALKLSRIDLKILMIVQILAVLRLGSGTISIATYVSEILVSAKWDYLSVEVAMTIYGIVTLFFIIIAMLCVDSLGRRPLLILSCAGTGCCTFLLGMFFYLDINKNVDLENIRWIPMLVLITYSMFFAIGLGPVTQTIQSELFPTNMRALGNIVTAYVLTVTSFLCLRFYQVISDIIGVFGNYFIFSVISFAGAIYVYFYLPETKGKTFLEISEFFSGKKETMPVKNATNTKL